METRDHLIEFLRTIARPEADIDSVGDEESLVDAGIVDSLAVVQTILYLETVHKVDVGAVDPLELVSIRGILSAIGR